MGPRGAAARAERPAARDARAPARDRGALMVAVTASPVVTKPSPRLERLRASEAKARATYYEAKARADAANREQDRARFYWSEAVQDRVRAEQREQGR